MIPLLSGKSIFVSLTDNEQSVVPMTTHRPVISSCSNGYKTENARSVNKIKPFQYSYQNKLLDVIM